MEQVSWERLSAETLRRLAEANAVVLLPAASVEQHGPHLPTGTDALLCSEVCVRAARLASSGMPVVVAPTVWMGLAEYHISSGGTFSLSLSTYHALLFDLCRSIVRSGFSRIVIVNGHGGNAGALDAIKVDLSRELGVRIAVTSYLTFARSVVSEVLEDQKGVEHACEGETSMMMAVCPDLVAREKLAEAHGPKSMRALNPGPFSVARSFLELTPSGVVGDARRATAEKGEKILSAVAEGMSDALMRADLW